MKFKAHRIICALLTLCLLLAVLGGCRSASEGSAQSQSGSENKPVVTDQDASQDSAQAAAPEEGEAFDEQFGVSTASYPVTVENYGRTVTVEQCPQRVLTLGPNCTELFAALGLQDLVIGRSLVNHSRGPLPEYADAVDSIPQLNYSSATREAVLSSGADFVYAIDWEIGDTGCNIEEAEKNGMQVYVNSATTLEEQYEEILDLGKIFGIESRAEEFVAEQKARIQAVQDKIAGQQPLKVLVYDSGNDGVFTCSGTNFESLLV
mgnify:CR=1 FL=1